MADTSTAAAPGTPRTADPITVEIVRNGVLAVTEEMKTNLMRTAYDMTIYEALDFTVGLFTGAGETVSIGLGLPMFIRGMSETATARIARDGVHRRRRHPQQPDRTSRGQAPDLVETYALRTDSGRAGESRGGLGADLVVEALSPMSLSTTIDRVHCKLWRLASSLPGDGNAVGLRGAGAWRHDLPNAKLSNHRLRRGDAFLIRSGGGAASGTLSRAMRSASPSTCAGTTFRAKRSSATTASPSPRTARWTSTGRRRCGGLPGRPASVPVLDRRRSIPEGTNMASYRLLTYLDAGHSRPAVAVDGRVYDFAAVDGLADTPSIQELLDGWQALRPHLERFASAPSGDARRLDGLQLLPAVPRPGAIYCAGANYRDHVINMARRLGVDPEPDPHDLGLSPWHFLKSGWCAVGQDARVELDCGFLDWEAELAVVIGRKARRIAAGDVPAHVAGYTIANDLSARDRMKRSPVDDRSPFKYDWIGHKNFDGSCPLGPWIVPASEVGDPQNLAIRCSVNDVLKQDSTTGQMLFTTAEQVAHLSSRVTLHPGDVVLTGTPAGVGAETGECLKRGDRVRVEIEGLGALVTHIV